MSKENTSESKWDVSSAGVKGALVGTGLMMGIRLLYDKYAEELRELLDENKDDIYPLYMDAPPDEQDLNLWNMWKSARDKEVAKVTESAGYFAPDKFMENGIDIDLSK